MRTYRKLAVIPMALAMIFAGATAAFAKPTYVVTASANHTAISYGAKITISGKVSNGPVNGKQVTLYWTRASEEDSWHKFGTDKLSSSGHYSKSYKPKFGGDIQFLVTIPHTSSHRGASDNTSVVKVYQWQTARADSIYGLGGFSITDGTNGATVKRKSAKIDGTTFKHSIVINDGAQINLDTRECKAFRAHVGVSDTSHSGIFGQYDVSQEGGPNLSSAPNRKRGQSAISESFALNTDKTTDVIADFNDSTDGGVTNEWVLGNVEVKCNAPA